MTSLFSHLLSRLSAANLVRSLNGQWRSMIIMIMETFFISNDTKIQIIKTIKNTVNHTLALEFPRVLSTIEDYSWSPMSLV